MLTNLVLSFFIAIAWAYPPINSWSGKTVDTKEGRSFLFIEIINEGVSGVVYRARELRNGADTGNDVAIKVLHENGDSITNMEIQQRYEKALPFINKNSHVFLSYELQRFHRSTNSWNHSFFVMPLLKNTITDEMVEKDTPENVERRILLAVELGEFFLRAASVMLASGISHGDIKPANIGRLHDGTMRLIDFDGFHETKGRTVFTRDYAAPEVQSRFKTTTTSDFYSMASTLAEVLFAYSYTSIHITRNGITIRDNERLPLLFRNMREQMEKMKLPATYFKHLQALELLIIASVEYDHGKRRDRLIDAFAQLRKQNLLSESMPYTLQSLEEQLVIDRETKTLLQKFIIQCKGIF